MQESEQGPVDVQGVGSAEPGAGEQGQDVLERALCPPTAVRAAAGGRRRTSALFALTSGAVQDKVADEFQGTEAELIRTNLSDEQEAQLREAFGLED